MNDLASRLMIAELQDRLKSVGTVPEIHRIGLPEFNYRVEAVHGLEAYSLYDKNGSLTSPTYFPITQGVAASFNRSVYYNMGLVIGSEARIWAATGGLAKSKRPIGPSVRCPVLNLIRDPRWGRSDEAASEDPFLTAEFGKYVVLGVQGGNRSVAEVKHFAAYDIETNATFGHDGRKGFNANVTPFDWTDSYVVPFEAAISAARAKAYMCSYNAVNGTPSCANGKLSGLARSQWGMSGFVESDCDAVKDLQSNFHLASTDADASAMAINNGTDLDCGYTFDGIEDAVKDGTLTRAAVETSFKNAMRPLFEVGLFDDQEPEGVIKEGDIRSAMAFDAARQSLVLLKNNNSALPLAKDAKIALVGPLGFVKEQLVGPITIGPCVPAENPENLGGGYKEDYSCIETLNETLKPSYAAPGAVNITSMDDSLIPEAIAAALQADAVIFALGAGLETVDEADDLQSIALPGIQNKLVTSVCNVLPLSTPKIAVLVMGNQYSVSEWVNSVDAIVHAFIPSYGRKPAAVIVDALYGDNDGRFGKLPYTLYASEYVDGLDLTNMSFLGRGYRYYTGDLITYPFGHGLSYTTFSLTLEESLQRSDDLVEAKIIVQNLGDTMADEVVQLYFRPIELSQPVNTHLPMKRLFDFSRVRVAAHSSVVVVFRFSLDALSLVAKNGTRAVFPGKYEIFATNGNANSPEILVDVVIIENHASLVKSR